MPKLLVLLSGLVIALILSGPAQADPKLPEDIQWLTNDSDPVYASSDAVKGGTLNTAVLSFPMTFRTVGPDSNGNFRSAIGQDDFRNVEDFLQQGAVANREAAALQMNFRFQTFADLLLLAGFFQVFVDLAAQEQDFFPAG